MVTTQTQIRRDTATNLNAATPVSGELGADTTNKRIVLGDGSTAGGIKHANAKDIQNQSFTAATVGGTANAITLTCSPTVTSYATPLKITFKPTSDSSSAVTLNVDGLGAKDAKYALDNVLTAFSSTTILKSGLYYEAVYDGTQFQILGIGQTTPTIPASGLVHIATQTASSSASLAFSSSSFNSSLYDEYVFELENINASSTGATKLDVYCSIDNGSTFLNAKARYNKSSISGAAAAIKIIDGINVLTATGLYGHGTVKLYNKASNNFRALSSCIVFADASGITSGDAEATINAGSATAVNYIKFQFDVGNITSGTIKMYGVSKS